MSNVPNILVEYYRSEDFANDYALFAKRNPEAASKQLKLIIERLNSNLAAAGVGLSPLELANQEAFSKGELPIEKMLELVAQYADSIERRSHY